MKKINLSVFRNTISAGLLGLFLTACGGGGGGDSSGTSPTPGPVLTGVLTDAVVSGVTYSTATRSGVTNGGGEYEYIAGEMVTFSIGGIQLGTVLAGPIITPLTLAGTSDPADQHVINIVRLLMTLDFDGNPDNGIQITAATRAAAAGVSIDFDIPVADFTADAGVVAFVSAADTTNTALVDSGTAQNHIVNTLASTWGLMEWGVGQWSGN